MVGLFFVCSLLPLPMCHLGRPHASGKLLQGKPKHAEESKDLSYASPYLPYKKRHIRCSHAGYPFRYAPPCVILSGHTLRVSSIRTSLCSQKSRKIFLLLRHIFHHRKGASSIPMQDTIFAMLLPCVILSGRTLQVSSCKASLSTRKSRKIFLTLRHIFHTRKGISAVPMQDTLFTMLLPCVILSGPTLQVSSCKTSLSTRKSRKIFLSLRSWLPYGIREAFSFRSASHS